MRLLEASGVAAPRRPDAVLRQLELLVSRRVDGLLQGEYQGLVPGVGSVPGEGRPYQEGDDVRRIDWNLSARTRVTHVRDAVADRELETWAVVDRSASLRFGTGRCEKADLALAAVACVGFLTERPGNRMGALLVEPGGTVRVPARGGRQALMALLHRLSSPGPPDGSGGADLGGALAGLVRAPVRRGLVVVVSDFLEPGWEKPLRALAARHQVLAVEVVDPRELELPDVGFLTLVDPETGARLQVQTARADLRRRFAEAAAAQRSATAASLRSCGAQHLVLRTDRDWLAEVVRFVMAARRRRSALGRSPAASLPAAGAPAGTSGR